MDPNFIANRLRILSSASGVHRCLRQNHSKRWTKCTMPAPGSFNATKLAKHLSISVDRSCSILCRGSLVSFFGLRTVLRHLLSSSNHGIISFPKRKTNGWHSAVGSDEHGMLRVVPESGSSLAFQIRLRSDHSALFGALQIVLKHIIS